MWSTFFCLSHFTLRCECGIFTLGLWGTLHHSLSFEVVLNVSRGLYFSIKNRDFILYEILFNVAKNINSYYMLHTRLADARRRCRRHRSPLRTILTNVSCLCYIHQYFHTIPLILLTAHSSLFKNTLNLIWKCSSRPFSSNITLHVGYIYLFILHYYLHVLTPIRHIFSYILAVLWMCGPYSRPNAVVHSYAVTRNQHV